MFGEPHYQKDVLSALLKWTLIVGPLAALLNLVGYFFDPLWTTPVGSIGIAVLSLIAWRCLRLLRQGRIRRAVRMYVVSGMCIMALSIFIAGRNEVLLGAMGMGVFVVMATFFEPPAHALRWGLLAAFLYEFAFVARNLVPSLTIGVYVDILSLYIAPPVILVFLAMAGRIMNVHLLGALEASEEAAHDLARSYSEVEQRVNERTLDLIKERYRLSEALRELTVARDRAEAASRAKSAFLANMSHELRTPLTTILGYTALIEHEIASLGRPTLESDLGRIGIAGNHLLGLISDVLDLAEVEAGTLQLNPEPFALAELIDDAVASTRPLVARKNNQLDLIYEGDPCTLRHDRSKVRQILVNILSNAAKFTEHGSITLEVCRQMASQIVDSDQQPRPEASTGDQPANGDWVMFRVTDTGIGISPDQLRQILHPFTQGDAAIKYMYGGAGLGLAICHRYAQLMGGDIAVESVEARGTICTVYLPLEQRLAPSAPEQPPDTSESVEPTAAVICCK